MAHAARNSSPPSGTKSSDSGNLRLTGSVLWVSCWMFKDMLRDFLFSASNESKGLQVMMEVIHRMIVIGAGILVLLCTAAHPLALFTFLEVISPRYWALIAIGLLITLEAATSLRNWKDWRGSVFLQLVEVFWWLMVLNTATVGHPWVMLLVPLMLFDGLPYTVLFTGFVIPLIIEKLTDGRITLPTTKYFLNCAFVIFLLSLIYEQLAENTKTELRKYIRAAVFGTVAVLLLVCAFHYRTKEAVKAMHGASPSGKPYLGSTVI